MADYPIMSRRARFDEARLYRYFLQVSFTAGRRIIGWLGHNPSVADDTSDDPTSHRIWSYSWDWGYDHAIIMNPWAYVATDKADLWRAADPVGPENMDVLAKLAVLIRDSGGEIVLCYGVLPKHACAHVDAVRTMLAETGVTLSKLSLSHQGFPRHPLYLESDLRATPWREPAFLPYSPPRPIPPDQTPVRIARREPTARFHPSAVVPVPLPPSPATAQPMPVQPAANVNANNGNSGLPRRRTK